MIRDQSVGIQGELEEHKVEMERVQEKQREEEMRAGQMR